MAARVNIKIVVLLVVGVFSAAAILGMLYLMQVRRDPVRYIRMAEQLKAEGDLRRAEQAYARAVGLDPGNREYLRLMEEMLLQIRPESRDDARELYQQRLAVLRHAARHFPNDPEAHLRLLRELHYAARLLLNRVEYWQQLASDADEMFQRVPVAEANRIYARLYRGLANVRLSASLQEQEIQEAESDLLVFVDTVPGGDLGWSALAEGQMGLGYNLRAQNRIDEAQERFNQVDRTLIKALEYVPDGPEVARTRLLWLAIKRQEEETAVTDEELRQAADRVAVLLQDAEDPWLFTETADILRAIPVIDGRNRALDLLQAYLDRYPDAIYHRLFLARLQDRAEEFDASWANARTVLDAEPLTVSFLARVQLDLKRQAALHIADVEYRRWSLADEQEKPIQLEAIQAARDELAALVDDPESDQLLARADGKLAYARGKYGEAASEFERLVQEEDGSDAEILILAARCLERLGQVGLAQERLDRAAQLRPGNVPLMLEKARLEYDLRRVADARITLQQILEIDPEYLPAQRLAYLVDRQLAGDEAQTSDPVMQVLDEAQQALSAGDADRARATLLNYLDTASDNPQVLGTLVQIELGAGDREQAQAYLDRALALSPNEPNLLIFQSLLSTEDPIERIVRYFESTVDDEADRVLAILANLRAMAAGQREVAQAAEDPAAADAARRLAERAEQAAGEYLERAQTLAPDHPVLLESDFAIALQNQDWPAVEAIVRRARDVNADLANGLIFEGRYEMARGNIEAAIRALEEATTIKGYSASAWSDLAVAYRRVGNLVEATRAFEQAYRCNPNDLRIVRQLASLLLQTGERTRALMVMRTARRLVPDDQPLQDLWLTLEADVGDLALALETRREIFERDPDDQLNAARLASLLGGSTPRRDLILNDDGEPLYAAGTWDRMTLEERDTIIDSTRRQWWQEADDIIDQLLASADTDDRIFDLTMLRADLLFKRGDVDQSRQIVQEFLLQRSDEQITVAMLIRLAGLQAEHGRSAEAVETLRQARGRQDPESRQVDAALAAFLFDLRRFDEALEAYDRMLDVSDDRTTRLRALECLIRLGRFDEASRRLDELETGADPGSVILLLRASILRGQGVAFAEQGRLEQSRQKFAECLALLKRAELRQPNDAVPLILSAQTLLRQYAATPEGEQSPVLLEDALAALDRATTLQAGEPRIAMTRVDVLLAMGDRQAAISQLAQFVEDRPADIPARRRLIELYILEDQLSAAIDQAGRAIDAMPALADWHEMLGDIYFLQARDHASAVEPYREAFRRRPSQQLLTKWADASLAIRNPDYASVAEFIASHPQFLQEGGILRLVYAKALAGAGRQPLAVEQMRAVYADINDRINAGTAQPEVIGRWFEVLTPVFAGAQVEEAEDFVMELCGQDPNVFELRGLVGVYRYAGPDTYDRMVELAAQAVATCPPDRADLLAALIRELSNCHYLVGDYEKAAEVCMQLVELQPDNPNALNDYAYLVAEYLQDPQTALPYAQQAVELRPDDPAILDTLAWTHYRLGQYEEARSVLQPVISGNASAANLLHMAHILLELGEFEEAERHLRRASQLRPDPQTQADIDRLADDIRTRRSRAE